MKPWNTVIVYSVKKIQFRIGKSRVTKPKLHSKSVCSCSCAFFKYMSHPAMVKVHVNSKHTNTLCFKKKVIHLNSNQLYHYFLGPVNVNDQEQDIKRQVRNLWAPKKEATQKR